MSGIVSEYRKLAEQCEHLAEQAEEEQYRLLLLRVAAKCRELANQAAVDRSDVGRARRHAVRIRQMRDMTKEIMDRSGTRKLPNRSI